MAKKDDYQHEYGVETDRDVLNKIKVAVYIAIALLGVNTILHIASFNSEGEGNVNTNEQQSGEYDVSMLTAINADNFVEFFKGSDLKIIYMGREDCGYCVSFLPTLQKSLEDYDYTLHYYDINSNSDTASVEKIQALDEFFKENYGVTPIVVFVKDNKVVDQLVGAVDYETVESLLVKNNISKK